MEIALGILIVIGGVMFLGSMFNYDDLIRDVWKNKVEIARESRLAAEATLEATRIKASNASRSQL